MTAPPPSPPLAPALSPSSPGVQVMSPMVSNPMAPIAQLHVQPIPIIIKKTPVSLPRKIVAIKNRRRKGGELQYSVVYDGEQATKGHWLPASQLTCTDLIEAFEQNRSTQKPAEPKQPVEIVGIVDHEVEPFGFIVKFAGSTKPKMVTRGFLHKHAPQLLIEFYERNLQFEEKPEPKKRVKKEKPPQVEEAEGEAVEREPAPSQDGQSAVPVDGDGL